MEDTIIRIEPLEFHWREWRERAEALQPRVRAVYGDPKAMLMAVSNWQKENSEWFLSFTPKRQRDLTELLVAELDMLFDLIDPGKGPKPSGDSWQRDDFRERFFIAEPLVSVIERASVNVPFLRSYLDRLRSFAEGKGWLP